MPASPSSGGGSPRWGVSLADTGGMLHWTKPPSPGASSTDGDDPRDAARQRREDVLAARAAAAMRLHPAEDDETASADTEPALHAGVPKTAPTVAAEDATGDWTSWAIEGLSAAVTAAVAAATGEEVDAPGAAAAAVATPTAAEAAASSPTAWITSYILGDGSEDADGTEQHSGQQPPADGEDGDATEEEAAVTAWNPWRECAAPPRPRTQDTTSELE